MKIYNNQGYMKTTKYNTPIHRIKMRTFINIFEDLFPEGKWIIHHKDGDSTNNETSNLCIMTDGEHSSIHNIGRICTEERRKNQSLGHRGQTWSKFPYAHYRKDRDKWETRIRFYNHIRRFLWFDEPVSASIVGKLIAAEEVNGHGR